MYGMKNYSRSALFFANHILLHTTILCAASLLVSCVSPDEKKTEFRPEKAVTELSSQTKEESWINSLTSKYGSDDNSNYLYLPNYLNLRSRRPSEIVSFGAPFYSGERKKVYLYGESGPIVSLKFTYSGSGDLHAVMGISKKSFEDGYLPPPEVFYGNQGGLKVLAVNGEVALGPNLELIPAGFQKPDDYQKDDYLHIGVVPASDVGSLGFYFGLKNDVAPLEKYGKDKPFDERLALSFSVPKTEFSNLEYAFKVECKEYYRTKSNELEKKKDLSSNDFFFDNKQKFYSNE